MQAGLTIGDMAAEIQRINDAKHDFVAPSSKLSFAPSTTVGTGVVDMVVEGNGVYTVGPVAHEQVADKLQIPRKYYNRMLAEAPALLSENVNAWLGRADDKKLVRVLDGQVRAVLSDKYRPFDHMLMAQASLPYLLEESRKGGLKILSSFLTERRLYIQAVTPRISGEVRRGDVVQAGIVLSNSEVGMGRFMVEEMLYRLVCLNGAIVGEAFKRHHVGRRLDGDEIQVAEYYASDTIAADNQAFILKVRDTVKNAFSEEAFGRRLDAMKAVADKDFRPSKAEAVVEEVTERFSLSVGEGENILYRLVRGGDFTLYGVGNAVTALANDTKDQDRVIELERVGGRIFEMPKREMEMVLARAA